MKGKGSRAHRKGILEVKMDIFLEEQGALHWKMGILLKAPKSHFVDMEKCGLRVVSQHRGQ